MSKPVPRILLAMTVAVVALPAASTVAASVKLTPVKGATYAGEVHSEAISVKVARNGKTATVSLGAAPGFCQGGSGAEPHHSKPVAISKSGTLSDTITYETSGIHPGKLATVAIKGHFYTFGSATPVFQGTVKSTWLLSGTSDCDGQESFQATKR
jgi:hypothetical protein